MIFWIGILVGAAFAWLSVRTGFLEAWARLFNIVIAVYVAVFSTIAIVEAIPATGETVYGYCLTMAATATGCFALLSGITYVFLTGQFKVNFPKAFDVLGAGVIGFVTGLLAWSFFVLLLSVTPLDRSDWTRSIGVGSETQHAHIKYTSWWCDLVGGVTMPSDARISTEQMIAQIAERIMQARRTAEPHEPEEPQATAAGGVFEGQPASHAQFRQ